MTAIDPQAEEVQARHAYEIGRTAKAAVLRGKWRDALELPTDAEIPTNAIELATYRACLMELLSVALGQATEDVVTEDGKVVAKRVSTGHRLRAMELAFKLKIDTQRLHAEEQGKVQPQPQVSVHMQPTAAGQQSAPAGVVITQEQAVEILKQRRLRLAGGV